VPQKYFDAPEFHLEAVDIPSMPLNDSESRSSSSTAEEKAVSKLRRDAEARRLRRLREVRRRLRGPVTIRRAA
jgi:hypothetical protein